jgi:hypothetical protein
MDHSYDIFRTLPDDGRPVWIEAVATLEQASAICADSGWPAFREGTISITVPGMTVLGGSRVRLVSRFNCAIRTDVVTRGFAISFSALVRVAFSDRFRLSYVTSTSSATYYPDDQANHHQRADNSDPNI